MSSTNINLVGRTFQMTGSNPSPGKVLTSADNNGRAVWTTVSGISPPAPLNESVFEWSTFLVSPDYTQFNEYLPPGTKTYTDVQTAIVAANAQYVSAGNQRRCLVLIRPGNYTPPVSGYFELLEGVDLKAAAASDSSSDVIQYLVNPGTLSIKTVLLQGSLYVNIAGLSYCRLDNIGVYTETLGAPGTPTAGALVIGPANVAPVVATDCLFSVQPPSIVDGNASLVIGSQNIDVRVTLDNCVLTNFATGDCIFANPTTGSVNYVLNFNDCTLNSGFHFSVGTDSVVNATFTACRFNGGGQGLRTLWANYQAASTNANVQVFFRDCFMSNVEFKQENLFSGTSYISYAIIGGLLGLVQFTSQNDGNGSPNDVKIAASAISSITGISFSHADLILFNCNVTMATNAQVFMSNASNFQINGTQWLSSFSAGAVPGPAIFNLDDTEFGVRNSSLGFARDGSNTTVVTILFSNTIDTSSNVTLYNSSISLLSLDGSAQDKQILFIPNGPGPSSGYVKITNCFLEGGSIQLYTSGTINLSGSTFTGQTGAVNTLKLAASNTGNGLIVSNCNFDTYEVMSVDSSDLIIIPLPSSSAIFSNCYINVSGFYIIPPIDSVVFLACTCFATPFFVGGAAGVLSGTGPTNDVSFSQSEVARIEAYADGSNAFHLGLLGSLIIGTIEFAPGTPNVQTDQQLSLIGNCINVEKNGTSGVLINSTFCFPPTSPLSPCEVITINNTVFAVDTSTAWISASPNPLLNGNLVWASQNNVFIGNPYDSTTIPPPVLTGGGVQ